MRDETPEDVFYRYGYYGLRNVAVMMLVTFTIIGAVMFFGWLT